MKYEKPELTALSPAINAIQGGQGVKPFNITSLDSSMYHEEAGAYQDWE